MKLLSTLTYSSYFIWLSHWPSCPLYYALILLSLYQTPMQISKPVSAFSFFFLVCRHSRYRSCSGMESPIRSFFVFSFYQTKRNKEKALVLPYIYTDIAQLMMQLWNKQYKHKMPTSAIYFKYWHFRGQLRVSNRRCLHAFTLAEEGQQGERGKGTLNLLRMLAIPDACSISFSVVFKADSFLFRHYAKQLWWFVPSQFSTVNWAIFC